MSTYKMCDIVTFNYVSPKSNDKNPIVLVVTPRWNGKMHGINLKNMPERERRLIMKIANPDYNISQLSYIDKIPALKNIITKRQKDLNNISSYSFYYKYIASFARRYNCYRQYNPSYMGSVKILDYDKVRI